MKKLLLSLSLLATILVMSCSEDVLNPFGDSSATMNVDGVAFNSLPGAVSYLEVSFDNETTYSINAILVNNEDTSSFAVSVPALEVASYTKANNIEEVSISASLNGTNYAVAFGTPNVDPTDFAINITEASEGRIVGNFEAVLINFDEETIEVDGTFIAEEFIFDLGGLN